MFFKVGMWSLGITLLEMTCGTLTDDDHYSCAADGKQGLVRLPPLPSLTGKFRSLPPARPAAVPCSWPSFKLNRPPAPHPPK